MRFAAFLTFFLHFSFFCLAASPHAAMELRGRVVDAERNPMVGAQVQLFEVGKKLPFDFRSTNGRGEFLFRIKQPRVVRLEIRAMGREDFTQELNLLTVANGDLDLGDILLQPHFEEINEVHVEAQKPVVRRSDTVAFRVGAFALGGEKSIEEVIKNMPGMKVEGDGKIRYQGREVERVMVGGADMFGRNYQLLTKNLDPTAVNEVQVLEHFEENRLMRRHRSSERVAMNIALKEGRGQLLGTLRAAYGYRNVHDAQLSLTGLFNRLQLNVLANSNQVGVSPAASASAWQAPQGLQDIAGGDLAKVGGASSSGVQQLRPITDVQGVQAPLSNERRRRNMSHMLSTGMVYTPSSKFRMNLSGVGQWEQDRFDSELMSDWNFRGQSITRREESHRGSRTYLVGGRLTLEGQASEMSDIRYDGGYNLIGDGNVVEGKLRGDTLRENATARWQRMDHTLLYTHSLDSAGLIRGGLEWQSQWLDPRYAARTVGSSALGFTTQDGVATCYNQAFHFGRTRWIYLAPSYKGLTGDVRLGASYSQQQLRVSDLWTNGETYSMGTLDTYVGGAISYTYEAFKVNALFLGHASRNALVLTPRESILNRWVYYPEPRLTLQVSHQAHLGVLTYGYNTSFSSLLGVLPRTLLTSFRSSYEGAPTFRVHYGHSAMVFYSYGIPTSRMTAEASVLYNYDPNPSTQRNMVMANRTLVYIMEGKRSDMLVANVKGDLFVPTIVTNFKLEVQGAQSRYTQYVNESALDVRSRQVFASLMSRTSVRGVVDVQLGGNWSMVRLDADGNQMVHHDMSQFAEIQVNVNSMRIDASADRVEVGINRSHSNAIYFLDANVEWEAIKERLTLYVEGRNLLNNKYYSQRNDSSIETVQMRYEIPSLQVLGGFRWNF